MTREAASAGQRKFVLPLRFPYAENRSTILAQWQERLLMAHGDDPLTSRTSSPPALGQLMSSYLQQQAEAHAAGLSDADAAGEVVPYDAGPVQPVDARL